jgi:hypothetical protein
MSVFPAREPEANERYRWRGAAARHDLLAPPRRLSENYGVPLLERLSSGASASRSAPCGVRKNVVEHAPHRYQRLPSGEGRMPRMRLRPHHGHAAGWSSWTKTWSVTTPCAPGRS